MTLNATRKGSGFEAAVRDFPAVVCKKPGKKKCPSGEDPDAYLFSNEACRKGTQVRVTWNAVASWLGLSSEEAWRANAGEARELTWAECFGECSLASYFVMAFVFPLMTEAAFGWQRGSRPGACLAASLFGMFITRSSIVMAPLPFGAAWYFIFLPALFMVTRENCRVSLSVSEIICTVLALWTAGMSRDDPQWLSYFQGVAQPATSHCWGFHCNWRSTWAKRESASAIPHWMFTPERKNKMKPTNPNAHTYVNGTDVNTHGYAVTHSTFLQ